MHDLAKITGLNLKIIHALPGIVRAMPCTWRAETNMNCKLQVETNACKVCVDVPSTNLNAPTFTVISLGAGLPRQKSHPFLDLLLRNVAANDAKAKPVG